MRTTHGVANTLAAGLFTLALAAFTPAAINADEAAEAALEPVQELVVESADADDSVDSAVEFEAEAADAEAAEDAVAEAEVTEDVAAVEPTEEADAQEAEADSDANSGDSTSGEELDNDKIEELDGDNTGDKDVDALKKLVSVSTPVEKIWVTDEAADEVNIHIEWSRKYIPDAEDLRKAMKGLGSDEELYGEVISWYTQVTPEDRAEVVGTQSDSYTEPASSGLQRAYYDRWEPGRYYLKDAQADLGNSSFFGMIYDLCTDPVNFNLGDDVKPNVEVHASDNGDSATFWIDLTLRAADGWKFIIENVRIPDDAVVTEKPEISGNEMTFSYSEEEGFIIKNNYTAVEEEPPADEPPADESPADEPPADEPPADEPPADEPPADEPPADEPPADEPPADEPPADIPPADEPPVAEEKPAAEPPVAEPPAAPQPAAPAPAAPAIARTGDTTLPMSLVLVGGLAGCAAIVAGARLRRSA